MAQQMVCDGCDAEPAVMILQTIGEADVKALGPNCLPTWLRSVADAIDPPDAPVTPDEQADAMAALNAIKSGELVEPDEHVEARNKGHLSATAGLTGEVTGTLDNPAFSQDPASTDVDAPVDYMPTEPAPATG